MNKIEKKATADAQIAHNGEKRKGGDEYFCHPKAVYEILDKLGCDTDTKIAGLLHDTVEHGKMTLDYICKNYGDKVEFMVNALTRTKNETAKESWHRLNILSEDEPHIVLVKMADRLHNLSTIDAFGGEKQKEYLCETKIDLMPIFEKKVNIKQFKNNEKYANFITQRNNMYFRIIEEIKKIEKDLIVNCKL